MEKKKEEATTTSVTVAPTVKIYGERNSGTNFLTILLRQNTNFFISSSHYTSGWKHGYPDIKNIPHSKRSNAVHIFIVRSPPLWLRSMYRRPYHMSVQGLLFEDFVKGGLSVKERRGDHPVHSDVRETEGNILDVMEKKYEAYIQFLSLPTVRGCIVSLHYLEKSPIKFLIAPAENFSHNGLRVNDKFQGVERHTKTNKVFKVEDGGNEDEREQAVMDNLLTGKKHLVEKINSLEVYWYT